MFIWRSSGSHQKFYQDQIEVAKAAEILAIPDQFEDVWNVSWIKPLIKVSDLETQTYFEFLYFQYNTDLQFCDLSQID